MRRLGPRREPGDRALGLTRAQAEAELRRLIGEEQRPPRRGAARPRAARAALPRAQGDDRAAPLDPAATTRAMLRVHLVPFFGGRSLDADHPGRGRGLHPRQAARGQVAQDGRPPPRPALVRCSATRSSAAWRASTRSTLADRPRQQQHRRRHPLPDDRGARGAARAPSPTTSSAGWSASLYLTAAMTGMRRGELRRAALARRRLDAPA